MGLLFFLVFSFGACVTVSASECVLETARCSEFWSKIEPHRNLWSTERDLNSWCRTQDRFYKCLEDILLEGKNGNLSYLPVNLLISKLFAKDLCTDGSHSRRRLLDNAACMNNLNTDYCNLPEYLDIVTPDEAIQASRCSFSEKTFSCIAATLVLNCGFDAGRVYRNMLKITRYSDEVCGIEVTEGIPPCDVRESWQKDRAERMSQIYYGLVRRIGSILEQDEEQALKEAQKQSDLEQLDVNKAIIQVMQEHLNIIGSVPEQEDEMQGSSKVEQGEYETEKIDVNQAVTEAIKEYLDRMGSMPEQENEIQGSSEVEKGRYEAKQVDGNQAITEAIQEYLDSMGSVPEQENEIQGSSEVEKGQYEAEQIDGNRAVTEAIKEYLDRMESMPEQENEMQDSSEVEQGRHDTEQIDGNQAVTEAIQEYLDRMGRAPEQDNEIQSSSKEAERRHESEHADLNTAVTGAIQNALNSLDSVVSEEHKFDYMMADDSHQSNVSDGNKLYMNPIITDIFKGILFYNYSDVEYAIYWRQPDFTGAENVSCGQLEPFKGFVLGCIMPYRYSDPDCLSKAAVHEKVTPELIRDLDPEVPDDSITEFGPLPHWMKDMDDAYEAKRLRDLAKTTGEPQVTESPDISTTAASLIHIASKMANKKAKNWWEWEIGKYTNSIIPNDLHLELMELFHPEPEKSAITPSDSWVFNDVNYMFIYDKTFVDPIEKATCSRLNECHPRGRGLWKCKVLARKTKPCEDCLGSTETTEDAVPEATPTAAPEGSGLLESSKSSIETESVQEHDANGSEHDQSVEDYLSDEDGDMNDEYPSEEDDLSETELKEAIADEINYKLETETEKQLKSDFRLLLLDSVIHPSRYEHLSKHADESDDVQIEDEEDSKWAKVPEVDEFRYLDEDSLDIQPISEDKSKIEYAFFRTPDVDIKHYDS